MNPRSFIAPAMPGEDRGEGFVTFARSGLRGPGGRGVLCRNVILRSAATKNLLVLSFEVGKRHKADPSLRSG
jgi:hypothetical protein